MANMQATGIGGMSHQTHTIYRNDDGQQEVVEWPPYNLYLQETGNYDGPSALVGAYENGTEEYDIAWVYMSPKVLYKIEQACRQRLHRHGLIQSPPKLTVHDQPLATLKVWEDKWKIVDEDWATEMLHHHSEDFPEGTDWGDVEGYLAEICECLLISIHSTNWRHQKTPKTKEANTYFNGTQADMPLNGPDHDRFETPFDDLSFQPMDGITAQVPPVSEGLSMDALHQHPPTFSTNEPTDFDVSGNDKSSTTELGNGAVHRAQYDEFEQVKHELDAEKAQEWNLLSRKRKAIDEMKEELARVKARNAKHNDDLSNWRSR